MSAKNATLHQAAAEHQQLLGVPQEEGFDLVTRLAARLLVTPWAAYTVTDGNRQRLKTKVGLDEVRETYRAMVFCDQVAGNDNPLIAEDVSADERIAERPQNPDSEQGRFYAGVPVRNPDLMTVGVLCVVDTKTRKTTGDELKTLAVLAGIIERELVLRALLRTDQVTALYNRRHFEVEIEREWRRLARCKSSIAAILVNLDQMSNYNETFGQDKGNDALRRVAERLAQRFLRPSDLLVRYGGDEFLVVLPETREAAAASLAEEIRAMVAALEITHPDASSGRLTVSVGCATTEPGAHFEREHLALLAAARSALNRAKESGRNRVEIAPSVRSDARSPLP